MNFSKKAFLVATSCIFVSSACFAHGIAYSTFPISDDQKLISTEFTGDLGTGGGVGMQGRFVYNPKIIPGVVDAGIGVSGGDRDFRLFAGYDYEIYPDYKNQPRVSVKGEFEYLRENDEGVKNFSIAPTVTKGFSFWGKEAYPYASIPLGLALNGDESTYENFVELTFGITGQLPVTGYSHLLLNAEANLGAINGESGVRVGISYPMF